MAAATSTFGIKYLYYAFLNKIKEDSRFNEDYKLLYSYTNIKIDKNNFYLMKIAQMLKKFPDIMVKIDPLIYKAYSDDLYLYIINYHPDFNNNFSNYPAAADAINAAAGAPAAGVPSAADVVTAANAVAAAAYASATDAATNASAAINAAAAAAPAAAAASFANPTIATIVNQTISADFIKCKLLCDLILFDILCRINFKAFDSGICNGNDRITSFLSKVVTIKTDKHTNYINNNTIDVMNNDKTIKSITRQLFLTENSEGIDKMNNYIKNFTIPMDKKIILYKILNFLINDDFINTSINNGQIIKVMFELITHETNGCAPRTILEELSIKGGNKSNKSVKIDKGNKSTKSVKIDNGNKSTNFSLKEQRRFKLGLGTINTRKTKKHRK